ncbi:MAG: hypothetical protein PHF31_16595 [Methylobacter sp.]|nr:hypothetical protein [Methylobacter sp.]
MAFLISCSLNALADNNWSYHQESDRLTNRTYSFARSPMPTRGLYDDIKLEIVCKDNNLQAVIDADSLIASQNSTFDVEYQIDKKAPVTIQMRIFKDSKRKGYSDEYAKRIADDILTGQSIFIRVHTLIKKVLSGSMSLENAAEPIKQVFADCSLAAADNLGSEPAYSLSEFEQEFNKLSPDQQQKVLGEIKKMMMEMH